MGLSLSRKSGEGVLCFTPDGRKLMFRVVKIMGSRVRISVNADDDVRVIRDELEEDTDDD